MTDHRSTSLPKAPPFPSTRPFHAGFAHNRFIIGGGVAIFHVASSRVVLCYHSRDKYWFLPKGRRDVHETTEQGAEREGFEESGYRNRLLPLPIQHRQPEPHTRVPLDTPSNAFVTEPVYADLYPFTSSCQYLSFWYISETMPPDLEAELDRVAEVDAQQSSMAGAVYKYPPPYPRELKLRNRVAMEPEGWTPRRHNGTGVSAEEALYESALVPVEEALEKLEQIPYMQFVVRAGWEAIVLRMKMEEEM